MAGRGGRGGGRGRGRGRGRGSGRGGPAVVNREPRVAGTKIDSGLPRAADSAIPDRLKACLTGWKEVPMSKTMYELVTEEEFKEAYMSASYINTSSNAVASVERHLNQSGREINTTNIITSLVSDATFLNLSNHTSEALVKRGLRRTNPIEMQTFLATKLLRSRFRMSTKMAWTTVLSSIAKANGFELMDMSRYNNILTCIRGYGISNRSGDNGTDVWIQRKNMLRNLNPIEVQMFNTSANLLFNKKDGRIVVDDELVSSRAKDVETKTISDKKAGNEGTIADQVSDSNVGFLLGSRLRVSGEPQKDNVSKLMKTLPIITQRSDCPGIGFDRGYTKEVEVVRPPIDQYEVIAICNTASRSPFVFKEDADEVEKSWRDKKHFQILDEEGKPIKETFVDDSGKTKVRNKLDAEKVMMCKEIFTPWILDDNSMLGSSVRIATKDVVNEDGKKVSLSAFAIHDIYDKKTETKHLNFLATGTSTRKFHHVWVASDKNVTVTSNHLFSDKKPCPLRQRVEQKLRANGIIPQTIHQRCMDWFALKGMMVTGTMGGIAYSAGKKIVQHQDGLSQETIDFDDDTHDEMLSDLLDKCIESWFGRGRKTTDAMEQGTKNEEPTLEHFSQLENVKAVFEVGLLKWNSEGNVGVSPDGVAIVKVPDGSCNDDEIACVEMKTRSKENTIAKAEEAVERAKQNSIDGDGKVVVCEYDDDVFKICVPAENRKQVIHQAVVTGLSLGVFITAKVEEVADDEPGQGSIVQIVFVRMSDEVKEEYEDTMLLVANQLTDWLLKPAAIARGYLEDEDFPRWVKEDAKEIIKSHFKLWSAFYRRVNETGPLNENETGTLNENKTGPLSPVGMVNHGSNFQYNKTKWGVDKGTEKFLKISGDDKLSFEAKYVLRLFYGVVGNAWHVELGRTLVMPFVKKYKDKNDGKLPSIESIRKKCESLTLHDYVFEASIKWLQQLERDRHGDIRAFFGIAPGVATPPRIRASRTASRTASLNAMDDNVRSMLMERRQKDWPVTRDRVKRFHKEQILRKIRLHVSVGFQHQIMKTSLSRTCSLCYSSHDAQKKVTTKCSICEVTLCTIPRPPSNTSCWEAWHSTVNLAAEGKTRADALAAQRQEERESDQAGFQARSARARNARRSRDELMAASAAADNGVDSAAENNVSAVDATVDGSTGEGSVVSAVAVTAAAAHGNNDNANVVTGGSNNNVSEESGIEDRVASLAIQNNIIAENESSRSASSSPRRKRSRKFFGALLGRR
eukprot:scaffold17539_cov76-Skeletonema_dohrnii-CCMP3373.AAC.1